MNPLVRLAHRLDVRPHEYRAFLVSALGAFLVISFTVASRAVRDAFFLDEFGTEWVPHMTLATTLVSVPAIAAFSRLLSRKDPQRVYAHLVAVLLAGLVLMQLVVDWPSGNWIVSMATIAFYLWTAAGSLLLTAAFWVVTSERFLLRDAKRLFGMISAGGTVGAMGAGLSLGPVAEAYGNAGLVYGLQLTLLAAYGLQFLLPAPRTTEPQLVDPPSSSSARATLRLVAATPHLRTMAMIVAVATVGSYLVDYQFKIAAAAAYPEDELLAGFFGRFYGVTGTLALVLQVLLASRLLARAGVAWSLSLLPIVLMTGSLAFLLVPGLAVATLVRGADNSLRRSVHRTVLEYLYVPIPNQLRRRTKAFIDSLVDSGADGAAAAVVWAWLAIGLPTRMLSVLVVGLACVFLLLARRMGAQYFRTLTQRLAEGRAEIRAETRAETGTDSAMSGFSGGDMSMSFTQFDMNTLLSHAALIPSPARKADRAGPVPRSERAGAGDLLEQRLSAGDDAVVAAALAEQDGWSAAHVEPLIRLLARDAHVRGARRVLAQLSEASVEQLARVLMDERADFVIRRRVPGPLSRIHDVAADQALLAGLSAGRFEVRYRSAVALGRRRRKRLPSAASTAEAVWAAVRSEIGHERPIWELQRLLDDRPQADDFVADRVYGRGELSLEHTFRMLALVLDPAAMRTAFHGVLSDDQRLRSISLEYLDQVLPADVRDHLWPFIGDLSDHQRGRAARDMGAVVDDLLKTGATLFGNPDDRKRLRDALDQADRPHRDDKRQR